MNHVEFASAIKAKYPQYADMSDADLTRAMMAKFPQYSDVDTSGMVAAPVARTVAPKAPLSAAEIISPRNAAAQVAGAPWPQRMAASGVDALTLPLRAVAGLGAGLGSIAGSRSKLAAALGQVNPDIAGSRADAIDAFQQTMAHPGQEAQQQQASGNVPRWMNYTPLDPRLNAGAAENPATLPLIATAGLPINSIGQGIAGTLASYTGNQAGNIAAGQPTEFLPSLGDLAPTVLGAAGEYLPGPLSNLGRGIQARAKALLTSQIKPKMARGGSENIGLQRGLDAGMLPVVAGRGTLSIPSIASRFGRALMATEEKYPSTLGALDASGNQVSTDAALQAADQHVASQISGGYLPTSIEEGNQGVNWVRDRLALPGQTDEVLSLMHGQKAPLLVRGPMVANTQSVPLSMERTVRAPMVNETAPAFESGGSQVAGGQEFDRVPVMDRDARTGEIRQSLDANMMPKFQLVPKTTQGRSISSDAPQQAFGQDLMPSRLPLDVSSVTIPGRSLTQTAGYRELVPGVAPAPQDVLIPPSVAHLRKAALLKEAFKDPTKSTARGAAAEGAGMNLRQALMQMSPEYEALSQEAAPLYAMRPAMATAAARQNRYPLSLGSLLHPFSMVQEMPATARALWDIGGIARGGGYLGPALAPTGAALSAYSGRQ